jgi:hypothetical protein
MSIAVKRYSPPPPKKKMDMWYSYLYSVEIAKRIFRNMSSKVKLQNCTVYIILYIDVQKTTTRYFTENLRAYMSFLLDYIFLLKEFVGWENSVR